MCVCPTSTTTTKKLCECDEGKYFNGKSCEICEIAHCKTCINKKVCKECNDGYDLKGDKCECKDGNKKCAKCPENCSYCDENENCTNCDEGFYINNENCEECGELCLECEINACLRCIGDAEKDKENNSNCKCKIGYSFTGACERNNFYANISINSDNVVTIEFSENPSDTLKIIDFTIDVEKISKNEYEIEFKSKSIREYLFKVISSSGIPENCKITIKLNRASLTSENNSLYAKSELTETLYAKTTSTSKSKQSQNPTTTISNLKNSAKPLTTATLASSAASSMFSNPSLFWILFNTLELISFMPIGSIPYPESLVTFFTYLNSLSIFPSPSSILGVAGEDYPAYYEARKYGIDTSLFLVNIDIILAHLILNLLFIALFFILRIFVARQFLNKLLGKYRYRYFLKLMIVGSLDFSLFGLIQLRIVFGI